MDHDTLDSLIDSTISCLTSFKERSLNEEKSKQLISDLSNLRAFMICLHLIKIMNVTLEMGRSVIKLFHKTDLDVLNYYINEIFKIKDPDTVCNLFKISSCKISTEKLSDNMQAHKINKLHAICEKNLKNILRDIDGMVFSQEDLEYFCSMLPGTFISNIIFNAANNNKKLEGKAIKEILYAVFYKTFQIVNSFATEKSFHEKVTFHSKNIEDV